VSKRQSRFGRHPKVSKRQSRFGRHPKVSKLRRGFGRRPPASMSKIKYIIKSMAIGTTVGGITGGFATTNRPSPPLRVLTQNISPDYYETPMTHILRGGLVGMFVACNVSIFPYWGIASFTICSCYAIEKAIANGYLIPAIDRTYGPKP